MSSPLAPPIALWVVPVSDVGGVARHALDALGHGIPGWRTVLLCPPGPLAEVARAAGIAVLTGPVSPDDGAATAMTEVRHVITRLRPAVVHSHLSFADLAVAGGSLGLPVAIVTTEHGIARDDLVYHGTRWRSRVRALAHTARLRRADALIAVSRSTLDVVREKWHPAAHLRAEVILNGVDPLVVPAHRSPGLHVVSLARLAPEKGLDHLLEAFALVAHRHPDARLTVAGTGPLQQQLQGQVDRLGLSDQVVMPGFVDAGEVLSAGDVLVQLSAWENCSYSLLDAQVHGLGVVASPVGGNPELLPSHCLVPATAHHRIAEAVIDQGLNLEARPVLDHGWPTVAAMGERIARVYADVTRP